MFVNIFEENGRLGVQEATEKTSKLEVDETADEVYTDVLFAVYTYIPNKQNVGGLPYMTTSYSNMSKRVKDGINHGYELKVSVFSTVNYEHLFTVESNGYKEFKVSADWGKLPIYLLSDVLKVMSKEQG